MTKKHVGMNETDYSLVNLSESEPITKLHTSALAGCLAVAAVFELDDKVALFLSHHPPSGNQIQAAKKLEPKIRELLELGYKPSVAAVIRPGEHHNNGTGWEVKAIDTTQADVDGYIEALGIVPSEVVYIPDHLSAGYNRDKEWGPGTAAIQVANEGEDATSVTRAYSEGAPIQLGPAK